MILNFIVKEGDKVEKGQVIGKVGPKNVYNVQQAILIKDSSEIQQMGLQQDAIVILL